MGIQCYLKSLIFFMHVYIQDMELYVILGFVAVGICFWSFNPFNSTTSFDSTKNSFNSASTEVPDGSNTSEALLHTIAY